MKPIDVKSNYFAKYNEESNEKDPKFKVGDHVRISKYKKDMVKDKDMVLIGVRRFLLWKKYKILYLRLT